MTTEKFTPKDEAVRAEIRERVDANLCVEAGAGTGKTTVLVDRIVRIIATGHARVDELAVITFTEKAAAELAGRVRKGLESARDAVLDGSAARERLDAALRDLNRAHMETIHAFASSLLRERPVEANLDPGFQVLDRLPAQLEFEAAYDEWFTAETTKDESPQALIDALDAGLDYKYVKEAAQALNTHRDLLPLEPYETAEPDIDALLRNLGAEVATLRSYEHCILDDQDPAYLEMKRMIELGSELDTLQSHPASLKRAILFAGDLKFSKGSQRRWRSPQDCRDVKESLTRVAQLLQAAAAPIKESATAGLVTWLQGFVQHYAARRKAAGKADFDDLLIWARDLVRDNHEVRRYFQQKYRCVLVDEFQDTDPLQAEMFIYLCEDGATATSWRDVRLRPGSLFVVGDPKQSIYRFRRADIGMYDDIKSALFADSVREIVQNFRSAQPIIGWVNDTFAQLFTAKTGVQPQYVALEHHPEHMSPREETITLLRATVDAKTSAGALRKLESAALASLIRKAVRDGDWKLRDGSAATYRDIVVLIAARAELETYEDAFARADVPHRHEGGRTFFARQEVREMIAILRAIDDPADGVAAVAALRSSAFGISDEQLLLHKRERRSFDYLSIPTDATGDVADALRTLRKLAAMRHTHTLPDIVRAVLDKTRLVEFAMLQPQGEQLGANLLKIIDQARSFADSGGGLRGFVRWLKDSTTRSAEETDAPISEETDDVVRILTIHASKGLEFPVVVFANMNTQRADRTTTIADRTSRRLELKLGKKSDGFVTPGFDAAHVLESEHDLAEELRLLYVAATRAKDRLVIPFFSDGKTVREAKCLNDWLRQASADAGDAVDPASLETLDEEVPVWRRPLATVAPAEITRVVEERQAWIEDHEALVAAASTPLDIRTASALKDDWQPHGAGDDNVRRGRAVDFGVAVHALLERIDLRTGDVSALARAVSLEFGLTDRAEEIARVAQNALNSDVVARALASTRLLREAPFSVRLPLAAHAGLAEGRIDLLFEENGGIVIVDFKTDNVKPGEIAARTDEYRGQALIYAWAAHVATGMPVTEVVFLYARAPAERRIIVGDVFMAEAEAMLAHPAVLVEHATDEPDRAAVPA